jgi:pimeloyl-ACP methyl ester carboxylesterase
VIDNISNFDVLSNSKLVAVMNLQKIARVNRCMMLVFAAAAMLATRGVAFEGDGTYARPGKFFTASDGTSLNFYCRGAGSPTVIFEAGEGDWSPAWATVQPEISKWTRTCSYDRSGAGFSALGPLPTNVERFVEELHSALRDGGVDGPYILVGHAYGGDIARAFADLYLRDVAGMVLVDPDEVDVETTHGLDEIWRGINERNLGYLTFCRDAVAAGKKFPLIPPPDHPGWTCLNYSFRGIPDPRFSPELNASLLGIMTTKTAMYEALLSGVGQRAQENEFLRAHRQSLGSRPLRLISTTYHISSTSTRPAAERIKFNQERRVFQGNLLGLSTNAKRIFADTGAFVQFEQPAIVIGAIRDVYDETK